MVRPKPHIKDIYRTPPPVETRFDRVRLDKNEFLPCWPQEWFDDFMKRIGPEHFSVHPELGPLYAKIEEVLGFAQDHVVVTAGSDAAIRSAFEVFVEPGDEVLIPSPTFAMYYVYSKVFGARLVEIAYEKGPRLDVAKLLAALSERTKLVAIANPNSPTGTVIDRDELLGVVDCAAAMGAAVLVDEAYYPFYEDSVADAVDDFDNLIVTRTLSKAAGIAGMRVGFAVSSPELARMLFGVKPMYEITTVSAMLAEYILSHYERVLMYSEETRAGRGQLAAYLRGKGFSTHEGHANFLSVDFGCDRDRLVSGLKDKGILFKEDSPASALSGYCRFTVGPADSLEALMHALEELG